MYQIESDKIYAKPDKKFNQTLWVSLLNKYSTIVSVAEMFKLNVRQLYKWKELKNNYPLKVLIALSENVGMSLDLMYIKTYRDSDILRNPKIILKKSPELIEFFGHLLHDGGIDSRYGVHYTTNSNSKILADRFERIVKHCFGELKVERRIEKNKITLYYPVILGYIITDTFKIPKGSKVENNVGVPSFIKSASGEEKWLYIITSYLCDGIRKRVAITCSSSSIHLLPKLLEDIKSMLIDLGIKTVIIKGSSEYKTKKGIHKAWILRILDKQEKNIFRTYLQKYGNFCS